jgi:DNA-directed RNA polymerase specialized sigma subunit
MAKLRRLLLTAQEYLRQAYKLDELINSLWAELQGYRGLTALVPSGTERVQTSPSADKIPNTVDKIIMQEEKINKEIDRLVDLKTEMHDKISLLTDKEEQLILRLRYLQYMEWADIADELHWSMSYIYKLHTKALNSFGDKIIQ